MEGGKIMAVTMWKGTKKISSKISGKILKTEFGSKLKTFGGKERQSIEKEQKPATPRPATTSCAVQDMGFTPLRSNSDSRNRDFSFDDDPVVGSDSPAVEHDEHAAGGSVPTTACTNSDGSSLQLQHQANNGLTFHGTFDFERSDDWADILRDVWVQAAVNIFASRMLQSVDLRVRPSVIPRFVKWDPSEEVLKVIKSDVISAGADAQEEEDLSVEAEKGRLDSVVSTAHSSIFEHVLNEMPSVYAKTWASMM
ncbi:hypothetical protein B0A48_03969 [Cryoendolithus antarcticus]|uniref:Uncharacterized protein n=1 Tax=Cryoendolithus antarcticus TaxID=1507870 RepID=A0A1V8THE9_9PEZI|nr:hypothetical protein B0A48_03969 [Cryoendolithus antarcticus]